MEAFDAPQPDGDGGDERQREGQHCEVGREGQPAGHALFLLALEVLLVVDERPGELCRCRRLGRRDRGVAGQEDGQAEDGAAALKSTGDLPPDVPTDAGALCALEALLATVRG